MLASQPRMFTENCSDLTPTMLPNYSIQNIFILCWIYSAGTPCKFLLCCHECVGSLLSRGHYYSICHSSNHFSCLEPSLIQDWLCVHVFMVKITVNLWASSDLILTSTTKHELKPLICALAGYTSLQSTRCVAYQARQPGPASFVAEVFDPRQGEPCMKDFTLAKAPRAAFVAKCFIAMPICKYTWTGCTGEKRLPVMDATRTSVNLIIWEHTRNIAAVWHFLGLKRSSSPFA